MLLKNVVGSLLALLAITSFLLLGCESKSAPPEQKVSEEGPIKESGTEAPAKSIVTTVFDVPPEKMRDALAEIYRLQPDRRFLLAVSEVHHFLTGEQKEEPSFVFESGLWRVSYKGREVGHLTELPDFKELLKILTGWAEALNKDYPVNLSSSNLQQDIDESNGNLKKFFAPYAAEATRQVDALWNEGRRDPVLLKSAVSALVLLNLQALDYMETADVLPAKALAQLALAKALTEYPLYREESMLSNAMGYYSHAERVALSLRSNDEVRLYVTGEDDQLKRVAEKNNGSIEARYLWLLRLAEYRDFEGWFKWRNKYFSDTSYTLPVLKAGIQLGTFSTNRNFSKALPHLVLLSMAQEAGMPRFEEVREKIKNNDYSEEELRAIIEGVLSILMLESTTLVERFEDGLEMLGERQSGPFLDSETYEAYYRGFFYSAFYMLGIHYLDSLSSIEAVNKFVESLGDSSHGTSADFMRWYRNLANSKKGKADPASMMEDLVSLSRFGWFPIKRSFDEVMKYFSYGDPKMLHAAKLVVPRMDTRVSHRISLANIAFSVLIDLRLAEKLYISAVEIGPSGYSNLKNWVYKFTGNHEKLMEFLHSNKTKPYSCAEILKYMSEKGEIDDKTIRGEYNRLIKKHPDDWYLRKYYAEYLEKTERYAGARKTLRDWLDRKVDTGGLEYIVAYEGIARAYQKEGKLKEAFNALAPVMDSMKGSMMLLTASLFDELGGTEEADEIYRMNLERYPDSFNSMAGYAKFLWAHKKYEQAATLIKTWPYPIRVYQWSGSLGKYFSEVFSNKPVDEGLAAFDTLIKAGNSHWNLQYIPREVFSEGGNSELACKMQSRLRWSGQGDYVLRIDQYRYLKGWQGKEAALGWLRKAIPPQMLNFSSMLFYQFKEFDLLWDFIEKPVEDGSAVAVWLVRAAASVKLGQEDDPHREELIKYFEENKDDGYAMMGRYLIGLISEDELLSLASNSKRRCEIPYFLGVRAQAEGRYEDASDWYRVAIETGLMENGEYRWAFNVLSSWRYEVKNLAQLSSEKL
jgi:hypothetical protein